MSSALYGWYHIQLQCTPTGIRFLEQPLGVRSCVGQKGQNGGSQPVEETSGYLGSGEQDDL